MSGSRTLSSVFLGLALGGSLAWSARGDDEPEANPYLADASLKAAELGKFLEKMRDKPDSIRRRPPFIAAILDAVERMLAAKDSDEALQLLAIATRFEVLHDAALTGNSDADAKLKEIALALKDDKRPEVARRSRLHCLEYTALEADKEQTPEEIGALADTIRKFLSEEKSLGAAHVRLASGAVRVINLLDDKPTRGNQFAALSDVLGKSANKRLKEYSAYLKKQAAIAKGEKPATPPKAIP